MRHRDSNVGDPVAGVVMVAVMRETTRGEKEGWV